MKTMEVKTMILWTRKGCRKPKMIGTATAECSAATIHDLRTAARAKEGKLWIVDSHSAAGARASIARHKAGDTASSIARGSGMVLSVDDGRTVALGFLAVLAVGGANESIRHWNDRIAHQGRVNTRQSRALTGDTEVDMIRALSDGPAGLLNGGAR